MSIITKQAVKWLALCAAAFVSSAGAEIRIGLIGPMSGAAAVYGTEAKAGAEFALAQLKEMRDKAAGEIRLISADSTGNPGLAAQAAERMVSSDGVTAIIGGMTSAETQAIIEVTRKAGVVQLSPLAQDNSLTRQGNQWFFRIAQSADDFGAKAARWMMQDHGAKRVFILARNDNYGISNADGFAAGLKELGGVEAGRATYEPAAKDFRPILRTVAQAKPDFVAIMGFYTDAALIVKQMGEMKMKVSIYANTAPGLPQFSQIAGPASIGTYGALYYFAGSVDTERGKQFVEQWKAAYKRAPSQYEAMGYDAMLLLAHTLGTLPDVKKATSEQLKDALLKVSGFQGGAGTISIKPNGDVERPLPFVRLGKNGLELDRLVQ
ncbi:ABC transporter substrate-binding protein [Parapusillimonas granuli]|uniref:Branched-chain amino acid ABC transporter substrate-binding protein n=1 Tax=Parapusillimonas granuli TaxID=380911 RepID=A0A853FXY5_9BURK|nr:branched-chain amino acid ABC transporter substrate-binding protein [Parapusillimonas granuli]MBB5215605.1 branched-chain amino acid transport system substrate-binding protein [Parapusillimonas granuli]MEB2401024.1 branched-chain amino acid ABC transporter substrate-binding protein [Alcaligenaceae bacterium]NYT49728.1 branched-chain amino acid ABC transporter substrate-binding protein [Parapusillimonas granuli]